MFILKLYYSAGKELKQGDIVRVDSGRGDRECAVFFAEVTWLEKEKAIAPFHTFSYHKFFKVDSVPPEAIKSSEERYNFWYINNGEKQRIRSGKSIPAKHNRRRGLSATTLTNGTK